MITFEQIRENERVLALLEAGNDALGVMGFTEHGRAHVGLTAHTAGDILQSLGYDERTCELARIAGWMHDIGNAVNRKEHAQSGAILAFQILSDLQMDPRECAAIVTAIGNHDESCASATTPLTAALILADKSDVRRSRVRHDLDSVHFDIHDRVNYAVVDSNLRVDKEQKLVRLKLTIDTDICAVMDYFEIFLSRMILCRAAAALLGLTFCLVINDTRML